MAIFSARYALRPSSLSVTSACRVPPVKQPVTTGGPQEPEPAEEEDKSDSDWEESDYYCESDDGNEDLLTVPEPEELEEISDEEKAKEVTITQHIISGQPQVPVTTSVTSAALPRNPAKTQRDQAIANMILNLQVIKEQIQLKGCAQACLHKIKDLKEFVQDHRFSIWNKEVSAKRRRMILFDMIKQTLSHRIALVVDGERVCRRAFEIIYGLLPHADRKCKSSSVSRWIRMVKKGESPQMYCLFSFYVVYIH